MLIYVALYFLGDGIVGLEETEGFSVGGGIEDFLGYDLGLAGGEE